MVVQHYQFERLNFASSARMYGMPELPDLLVQPEIAMVWSLL